MNSVISKDLYDDFCRKSATSNLRVMRECLAEKLFDEYVEAVDIQNSFGGDLEDFHNQWSPLIRACRETFRWNGVSSESIE